MFLPHLKKPVQEPAVIVSAPVESTAKPATVPDPPRRDFSEVKPEPAPEPRKPEYRCPYAMTATRNGKTFTRIGHWQDMCAYYSDGETVYAVFGSTWTNSGELSVFRERFATHTRGELYPLPVEPAAEPDDSPPVDFSEVKPEPAPVNTQQDDFTRNTIKRVRAELALNAEQCEGKRISNYTGNHYEFILPDGTRRHCIVKRSEGMKEARAALFELLWSESEWSPKNPTDFEDFDAWKSWKDSQTTAAEPAPEPLPNFGDNVQTPDGRTGTMRGAGGMGSDRVQFENAAGNRSWHNRSELRRVATEPAPAPTVETGSTCPPSEDFSDDHDTFEDFNGKENAVVAFGKDLEANRSAMIQDWTYRIEPQQDRPGFQIVMTSPEGTTETICSGFYGFAFDTFDRTVGYAVSKARGRFVCHPETLDNGCQIETRFHKRRGVFVYVVTLPEPVKGSKFDTLDNRAKKSGGWYAREYRPEYQRGGFMFPDRRNADRFGKEFTPSAKVATVRHTDTKPATTTETRAGDFSETEPSAEYSARIGRNVDHIARMTTAARLEELAAGMQKTIDEKTRPMSQNWTVKRGREYNSRCHDGRHYQRVQEALRVLAAHWRAGTVPDSMQQLKAKSAILPLLSCRWDSCTDRGTDEFTNHSPLAVELRELIEANRTGEHREQLAAAKRAAEIKAAEDNLRLRNVPGFFPTPPALVDRMVEQAQLPESPSEDFSVLEPSAGIGSIADGIASEISPDRIKCVEISSACCSVLELKGYNVGEGDFLQIPAGERFDRILMNPPFENGQDIDHVRHAFSLLKSGGRLVAIMSEGSFTTSKRKAVEFVEWIDSHCAEYETIRGAFDNSTAFRSTGVTVRLVTIDKD